MKFEEINVPEGTVQQIELKGPFAGITVDAVSMNMERERYLLSTDEMFEEMLS